MNDTQPITRIDSPPLLTLLSNNWWLVLLRGIAAIAFAITAFNWPGLTIGVLVIMWGAYAAIDGVFSLVAAIKGGSPTPRWWLIISGLLGVGAAVACFSAPGAVAAILVMIIGWWSIFRGMFEIIGALSLGKEVTGKAWLILSGVISLIFGGWLISTPAAGALAMLWLIAAFAAVFGVVLVLLSLRLRKLSKSGPTTVDA